MSDVVWKDVFSSRVTRVGYDPETQTLYLQFPRGKTAAYQGVPPDVAEECAKSWSIGEFMNSKIVGRYAFSYV